MVRQSSHEPGSRHKLNTSFKPGMDLEERRFLFQFFWTRPVDDSFYLRQ